MHIYELSGNRLKETRKISQAGAITSLAWSPNGSFLVATDANRKVTFADFFFLAIFFFPFLQSFRSY